MPLSAIIKLSISFISDESFPPGVPIFLCNTHPVYRPAKPVKQLFSEKDYAALSSMNGDIVRIAHDDKGLCNALIAEFPNITFITQVPDMPWTHFAFPKAVIAEDCEEPQLPLPSLIEEGLYLGDVDSARSEKVISSLQIGLIVNCTKDIPRTTQGVDFLRIPIDDLPGSDITAHFKEAIEAIDAARKSDRNVLVHCFAGISRSATIVAAYLMKKHGISSGEALTRIKAARPIVEPNLGFAIQLDEFGATLASQ